MADKNILNCSQSSNALWIRYCILASLPVILSCILSIIWSCAIMSYGQATEGRVVLIFSKNATFYHNLIDDLPGTFVSIGAIASTIILIAMALFRKIPTVFGLLFFVYPVIWFIAIFFIACNSLEAFP